MNSCIFCKIVSGEITCKKICETERILAFLDIYPVSKGHVLIIPKTHSKDIFELKEDDAAEILVVAKKIAESARKNLGAVAVNLLNSSGREAGQTVFHFHMHVMPRYSGDNLNIWPKSAYKEENPESIVKKLRCL